MTTAGSIGKIAEALAKAQGKIENAKKTEANPFFKSHYADLANIINVVRGPLTENGIAFVQGVSCEGDVVHVATRLIHSSGEWIEDTISIKAVKSDPQGMGSATTYARRYGLAAIVGVAQEDDDANEASGKTPARQAREETASIPVADAREEPASIPVADLGIAREELKRLILDPRFSDEDRKAFYAHLGEMKTGDMLAAYWKKWNGVLASKAA